MAAAQLGREGVSVEIIDLRSLSPFDWDAISATVRYLLNQLDPEVLARTEGAPLMEIQLELVASEIVWKPELTEGKVATR